MGGPNADKHNDFEQNASRCFNYRISTDFCKCIHMPVIQFPFIVQIIMCIRVVCLWIIKPIPVCLKFNVK